MEKGERGMYLPVDAIPRDIISRYGNVRVLVVPKERSASTSSCKENEECLSQMGGDVFDDDPKSRSTPVSPNYNFRQVFEYRTQNCESGRYTQELQDQEHILKTKTESTPKRVPEVRVYEKMADETVTQTPHKNPDVERKSAETVSEKARRQLFAGTMRNESYHWRQPETLEEHYAEKHAMYSLMDTRSPGPDHSRAFFGRDFNPYHDRPSPSWAIPAPQSPFPDHHRCECMERQHRHIDVNRDRERTEIAKKRKFADISSSENSIQLSPRIKKQKCTCSILEMNFLQMAEAAYKNIRRRDSTPASFEQFRTELVETNSVLKESVGIVSTIREMCEHRNCIRT